MDLTRIGLTDPQSFADRRHKVPRLLEANQALERQNSKKASVLLTLRLLRSKLRTNVLN